MNYRSSSWTGRAHRAMYSAFGPHCDHKLHPMPEPARNGWGGWLLATAIGIIGAALLAAWL